MDYSEFKCTWIEPASLRDIVDETRNKYWPEATLPVDAEAIVEFRLRLDIEPIKNLQSAIDIDAYQKETCLVLLSIMIATWRINLQIVCVSHLPMNWVIFFCIRSYI